MSAPMPRPRLLVVTPRFPYPVIGGDRLRIWQVARALAEHCDLTLLSLVESADDLAVSVPDDVFARVERFVHPPWRSWLDSGLALPGRTPLQVAYYRDRALARRMRTMAPRHDAILTHLVRTAGYALDASVPHFCELTDAISLNYERAPASSVRDVRSIAYGVERTRLRSFERKVVAAMDRSYVVSEVDRDVLTPPGDPLRDKLAVSPNGVDLAGLPFVGDRAGLTTAFIGNNTSLQNVDAARFAARAVLPLLRRSHPEARLRIVGRIHAADADELAALPGVEVTGEVPSIPEAVADCVAAIAPVRVAAGVQNKVLEYAALGLPAVVSPMALEGLGAAPGRELLVADDAAGYAAHIGRLLDEPGLRDSLARAARAYVEREHDWSRVLAPLVHDIVTAAASHRISSERAGTLIP